MLREVLLQARQQLLPPADPAIDLSQHPPCASLSLTQNLPFVPLTSPPLDPNDLSSDPHKHISWFRLDLGGIGVIHHHVAGLQVAVNDGRILRVEKRHARRYVHTPDTRTHECVYEYASVRLVSTHDYTHHDSRCSTLISFGGNRINAPSSPRGHSCRHA